jgi:copper resistance protein B
MFSTPTFAGGMDDDPLLTKVMVNQLEIRDAEGSNPLVADIQAWIGKDLHKLTIKGEFERVNNNTEEAEVQLLYSQAISPFWDMQIGIRKDFKPTPQREWLAFGLQGLAPYWFELDNTVFIGKDGQVALRIDAEYDLMFTQKWALSPELEVNFHSKNDVETGTGKGLSDVSLGLRLRYEIRREFAPYIGVSWSKKFAATADFAHEEGESSSDVQFVAGVKMWF